MHRSVTPWPAIVLPLTVAVLVAVRVVAGPLAPWSVVPVAFVLAAPMIAAGRMTGSGTPAASASGLHAPAGQPQQAAMVPLGADG